jgi:hypothetical protein
MYCPQCRTQVPDDSVFCHECGSRTYRGETKKEGTEAQVSSAVPQELSGESSRGYSERCGQELGVNEKMRGLTVHDGCPTPGPEAPPQAVASEGEGAASPISTAHLPAGAETTGERMGALAKAPIAPGGQERKAMFCHNCGARATEESLFCSRCGARVLLEAEYAPTATAMQRRTPTYGQQYARVATQASPAAEAVSGSQRFGWHIAASIVSSVIALLFFPPIFGAIGAILGGYIFAKGEKAIGLALIVVGVAAAVIGLLIAALVLSSAT